MIIIYGYGKLASKIAKDNTQGDEKLIICEPSPLEYDIAKKEDYAHEYYRLECYDDEDLEHLGIYEPQLKTFYCLHNDFNKNLFVTLSARNLRKDLQIISLARDDNDEKKLKLAGASKVLNPYALTGLKIFRYLHRPISLQIIDDILYGDSTLKIEEIKILKDSILDGVYLKTTNIFEKFNLIVLGLEDTEIKHDFIFASQGINHKIDSGDTLVVMGEAKNIQNFKEYIKG